MEARMDSLKRKPVSSFIDEKDLHAVMNMAIVLKGRQIDLLRLRSLVDELPELQRIYVDVSFMQFRINKLKDWEEFQKWKNSQTKP